MQVNFADVADYAFTVHGFLLLTTHPAALRGVITSHFLDPVGGQVFRESYTGDKLPAKCPVFILPLAETDGLPR